VVGYKLLWASRLRESALKDGCKNGGGDGEGDDADLIALEVTGAGVGDDGGAGGRIQG
jgi:hypothetical protein